MSNVIETKVKGGRLRAWVEDDPNYPGISVEFIPDYTNRNVLSYPRVLMEKPTESECLRALLWEKPDDEDFTTEIVFEEPSEPSEKEEEFEDPVDPVAALMSKIEEKAERDREKAEKEKIEIATRIDTAIRNIREIKGRIQSVLQLANKCKEEGILIPEKFFSNGVDHNVGFMGRNGNKKIEYVGFYNGGYCGPYDFYTNGDDVLQKSQHNRDSAFVVINTPVHAEKFLADIGTFEVDFYVWLECMVAK